MADRRTDGRTDRQTCTNNTQRQNKNSGLTTLWCLVDVTVVVFVFMFCCLFIFFSFCRFRLLPTFVPTICPKLKSTATTKLETNINNCTLFYSHTWVGLLLFLSDFVGGCWKLFKTPWFLADKMRPAASHLCCVFGVFVHIFLFLLFSISFSSTIFVVVVFGPNKW